MNTNLHWRRLSLAVAASLVLAAPAYAEVSHSQDITLAGRKTTENAQAPTGTITVSPEEKAALEAPATSQVQGTTTTTTSTTSTAQTSTDASQATESTSQENGENKPVYREVRRNGITYIEKVGKEQLEKEHKEQVVEDEQMLACLQQQKEIAEAQQKQEPGLSAMNPGSDAAVVNEYEKLAKQVAPYENLTITKITFEGNKNEETSSLNDALKMTAGTKFTSAGLQDDIRSLYETGWFYDIVPTFNRVPEGLQIVYHVAENPILTELEVEGNTKISTHDIKKAMNLKEGQVVNARDVNIGARKVENLYAEQGYILAKVADVRMLPDGHLILEVAEGVIEDFRVKGNTKTKDYVVIREMRMKKGDPFNAKLARRSMQKIYNLGFFEDVNIRLNPGQMPNTVSVEISVVEQSTGTFGIGAGYSDADGFLGMVTIGDKNFRGTGDSLNARWEFGGDDETNTNFEVSYIKPWIDDKETTMALSFYNMTNEYADYDRDGDEIARYYKKRIGEEITFSRVTDNEFITNQITLKNRDDKYKDTVDGYNYNQYFEGVDDGVFKGDDVAHKRREKNFGTTRSITFARILDTRDNIFDPREGKRTAYSVEWASFGGDFTFEKYQADYRYYYRMGKDNVWALNLGIGYANGDMPLSQRFAVGGSEFLRGYRDDQFKGNSMLKGSLEYRFPIFKQVQGVTFTDAGYAWSKDYDETDFDLSDLKYTVGLGLRINSPLGPIRLDYGYRLDGSDRGGRFHFSFGGQF
jgi:outer membrane protein insertion porin family